MRAAVVRRDVIDTELTVDRVITIGAWTGTHRGAFLTWLMGLLDHAELLHPAELREEVIARLEAIAATAPTPEPS